MTGYDAQTSNTDAGLAGIGRSLIGSDGGLSNEQILGRPVLLHFWAVGCSVCKEQLPTVVRWRKTFEGHGLRTLGVHAPAQGTPPGIDKPTVRDVAQRMGLTHPIVLDTTGAIAKSFQVTAVPAYFVFDAAGYLRHYHAGYTAEVLVERAIERVLDEYHSTRAGHANPDRGTRGE